MVSSVWIAVGIQASVITACILRNYDFNTIVGASIRTYVCVTDTLLATYKQTKRTLTAMQDSFGVERRGLVFFPDSISLLPLERADIVCIDSISNTWAEHDWIFNKGSRILCKDLDIHASNLKHVPYLAIELSDGTTTENLSDWAESIHVLKEERSIIPIRVLAQAYRWDIGSSLPVNVPWTLNVITEDGDEKSYDVMTGKEIVGENASNASNASNTSNT